MDTQIKITKNYFDVNKDNQLRLYGTDSFYLDLNQKFPVFNIEETDNVSLILEFDESKCIVEIESAITGKLENVTSGKEFILHLNGEELSFFPGYFDFCVKENNKTKRYFFCVHPKNAEIEDVLHLRTFVNNFCNGVSLDLEKKRSMKIVFDATNTFSNDFSNVNFIKTNFPSIINYMNRYIKTRHEEITQKEVVSNRFSKVTPKSVKWLMQKGMHKNSNINKPDILLTRKTSFTLDNEQNRLFKSYVIYWDIELNRLLNNINDYKIKIEHNLSSLEKEFQDRKRSYDNAKDVKAITNFAKKQLLGKVKETQEKIESLIFYKSEYDKKYIMIKRFKLFLENLRFNTWLSSVNEETNYLYKKVNIKELKLIKEMHDRYVGIKRRISFKTGQNIDYFAEKNTPKLFESYIYVLLINMLNNNGYHLDVDDVSKNDLIYLLSSQSSLILAKDGCGTCEIIYDKPLVEAGKDFIESEYCTINSTHNKPDFILSFKDENGLLLDSVVVEVKWRKLENIYNEHGDTEVAVNLKDYLNLAYYDSITNKIQKGVISKVIAAYPDSDERTSELINGLITYCGIKIGKNIDITKNYVLLNNLIINRM